MLCTTCHSFRISLMFCAPYQMHTMTMMKSVDSFALPFPSSFVCIITCFVNNTTISIFCLVGWDTEHAYNSSWFGMQQFVVYLRLQKPIHLPFISIKYHRVWVQVRQTARQIATCQLQQILPVSIVGKMPLVLVSRIRLESCWDWQYIRTRLLGLSNQVE